jgi:hypothetical protein
MNSILSRFGNNDPLSGVNIDDELHSEEFSGNVGVGSSIPSFAIPSTDVSSLSILSLCSQI